MLESKNTILAFRSVILQLRVPEMKYAVGDAARDEVVDRLASFIKEGLDRSGGQDGDSIVKAVEASFGLTPLPTNFNNAAFITDRMFDVWTRKNQLSDELNQAFSRWRFPLFVLLFRGAMDKQLRPFLTVIERISATQLGWSPSANHAKSHLLEHLDLLDATIRRRLLDAESLLDLPAMNEAFLIQQEEKRNKIVERLCARELLSARARYAMWQAIGSINQRFDGSQMADSILCFISRYWLPAMAHVFNMQDETLLAEFKRHQDQIYAVFCKKDKWTAKFGDDLIDVLGQSLHGINMSELVPDDVWSCIEKDIIALLQKETLEEFLYTPLVFTDEEVLQFVVPYSARNKPLEGDLYVMADANGQRRVCACMVEPNLQQLLLTDCLGIKVFVCAFPEFDGLIDQGVLKRISGANTVVQVFESTMSGLYKISDAQSKARVKAAEKAKQEAESMLADQRQAQVEAQERASEIASRTRELQLKQVEKQRLNRVKSVTAALSGLHVGGWIGLTVNDEVQRYKLAVKLAGLGKYIFVDRLGIKRLEFSEALLVDKIINNEITILSDGVEFENSLERVVSRLRIQK